MRTFVHAKKVPLRRVDCACGWVWLATPMPESDARDVCPKCGAAPRRGSLGPVKLYDLTIPIDIHAKGV